MRPERVRWGLTRRQCLAGSSASSSLHHGEVKKQPVFDDCKSGTWAARAFELPRIHATSVPAKYNFMAVSAGRGRIRARKLRVAARGGSGALAGSARWLRASRGGVRRAAGRSATHLARNAGRPGGKSTRQRRRADGRRRRGLNPSSHSQKTLSKASEFHTIHSGSSRCGDGDGSPYYGRRSAQLQGARALAGPSVPPPPHLSPAGASWVESCCTSCA